MAIDLSEDQLKELETWASNLFAPKEISVIMEIDYTELMNAIKSESGPVYKAFIKGKLITEAALRKTTIQFAKQGSSPALTAALKMSEELNLSLEKRF